MDLSSFDSQVDSLETAANSESFGLFTFYHPQYHPECVTYYDHHHGPFVVDEGECLGDSAYYPSTVSRKDLLSGPLGQDPWRRALINKLDELPYRF
jgi:hypothetical protein